MRYASALAVILALAPSAQADPRADAAAIVQATVTADIVSGALSAMRPVLISAISNDLQRLNIQLADPERFFDVFIEEFQAEFIAVMRDEMVDIQLNNFTPQELSDIAAFYTTSSGRALIAKTPVIMQASALIGQRAGQRAGQNAAPRVAARLEAEGIPMTTDPSLGQKLLDILRR